MQLRGAELQNQPRRTQRRKGRREKSTVRFSSTAKREKSAAAGWRVRVQRFKQVASPFWTNEGIRREAFTRAGSVLALTLLTTGVSVGFSYVGRDFMSAISEKDVPKFWRLLAYNVAGVSFAIPVFVFRGFLTSRYA